MLGGRRTLLLTLMALAAPIPAFALSGEAAEPVAEQGPVAISVSASLDSCGVLDDGVVCKLDVSYSAVPGAETYTATVTRADGSVVDVGSVAPGGTSLWVPYAGAGSYSVRVVAYGEPEDGERTATGEVLGSGVSRSPDDEKGDGRGSPRVVESEEIFEGRSEGSARTGPPQTGGGDGEVAAEPAPAASAEPACEEMPSAPPAEPEPLPEEPPEDLDPQNPDEDSDGIADEDERVAYEEALAARQDAAAEQAEASAPGC